MAEEMKVLEGSIVLGVPAKTAKKLSKDHKSRIAQNRKNYIDLKNIYINSKRDDLK